MFGLSAAISFSSFSTTMTQQQGNSQYWLGRLRDAEENPRGWIAANPQQGGGSQTAVPAAAPATNTDHSYWLGRLNQAEANAQKISSSKAVCDGVTVDG